MSSVEAAEERVQQTSYLVRLATENHNMAQEIVQLAKERDALDKKVLTSHSGISFAYCGLIIGAGLGESYEVG